MSRSNKWYGCIPDSQDSRDFMRSFSPAAAAKLPSIVSNMDLMPEIWNQGPAGTCGPHSFGGAFLADQKRQGMVELFDKPSFNFMYWVTRKIMGTLGEDSGVQIRDLFKAAVKYGVCRDSDHPYDPKAIEVKPSRKAFVHALNHQVLTYERIIDDSMKGDQRIDAVRSALAKRLPVVFGFNVYRDFESEEMAKTGRGMKLPRMFAQILGGHAVLHEGYNDAKAEFHTRNSWDKNWGASGYFFMPYDCVADRKFSRDFWVVQTVEAG